MTFELKIKDLIAAMGERPKMFASNKESFAFQIFNMLFLLNKMNSFEDKMNFFKYAEIIKGSCFVNCNDSFEDEWAKNIVNHALFLIG